MARRSPGDEPSHEWLVQALKAEADRHEPDRERIWQRIRDQESGVIASGDSTSLEEYRFRRRADEPFQRSAWLLPAAAAAFVVLTAGAITALHGSDQPTGASGPVRVVAPATVEPDPVTTSIPAAPSSPPPSSSSPSPSSAVRSTGSGTSRSPAPGSSSSGSGQKRRPALDVTSVVAKSTHAVDLSAGTEDWIAAGSASASDTVRSRDGGQVISGPHDQGTVTSTTTQGPFALSWSGGLSQARGSGSKTWRTVTGPVGGPETGLQIRVPADKQESELVLYVGADDADAQLRTKLSDGAEATRTKLRAGPAGRGYVVTIRFHAAASKQSLTVDLIGGSGGSVSFAAATLR